MKPKPNSARARPLSAARQRKRTEEVNAAFRAAGYRNFGHFLTLAKQGVVKLPRCPAEHARADLETK